MSRGLRYKITNLDTRPKLASFESRHHESNMSLSEGANRERPCGPRRGCRESGGVQESRRATGNLLPLNPLYKAEEKNTPIGKRKKWADRVDRSGSGGLC